MVNELDNFYLTHQEPVKSCLLALRTIILNQDKDITAEWKYRMPMFCYKGKMLCYLWAHKTLHQPYLGIVDGKLIDHAALITEKRARMKIMLFDADKDLPTADIEEVLRKALQIAQLKR
ncbi:DUF1801 domain-containing protein [Mucilaginibacter sp. HD30]